MNRFEHWKRHLADKLLLLCRGSGSLLSMLNAPVSARCAARDRCHMEGFQRCPVSHLDVWEKREERDAGSQSHKNYKE